MNRLKNIESCFIGLAIADALGVPVEFSDRSALRSNPVVTMTGQGTWNQPVGTWSDDSSLTFCLAESLCHGYDIQSIGEIFVKWMRDGYWGAHGKVFDIGGTTRVALQRIYDGGNAVYSGEFEEESNGNGSLMRIMPAAIYFHNEPNDILIERIREVSGVTHRHFRSVFSCFVFSKIVAHILKGTDKEQALADSVSEINAFISTNNFNPDEIALFERILNGSLDSSKEESIKSSGYVLHTLEASLWCFLKTSTYKEAVLHAVNLGGDTDTTACVTGALAGLYYGASGIPPNWRKVLVREKDIVTLAQNFSNVVR